MDPGIDIDIVGPDDPDMIELRVAASDGDFSGVAILYAAPDEPRRLAALLRGFPRDADDRRVWRIGGSERGDDASEVVLEFRCIDRAGHPIVAVDLAMADMTHRSRLSVSLVIPVEAAGVEAFARGLAQLSPAARETVRLPLVR